jgi:hypothetical protein
MLVLPSFQNFNQQALKARNIMANGAAFRGKQQEQQNKYVL